MSSLRWTCKSTRKLAEELTAQGYPVSHTKVAKLLDGLGYSLQSTRKTQEGASHPDHDTTQFAVETLRRWWYKMGVAAYAEASELLITADGGGSNARRSRLWKFELQRLADETGLTITVCHFPPGTSKWNKI